MKKKFTFLIAALFALMLITLPGMVMGQTWQKTSISDLTSTDVFVIVDEYYPYALPNDQATTGGSVTVVTVTLSNDKNTITSTVADNMKWNITGNATDGYTFYPNGTTTRRLYVIANNNGVRVANPTGTYCSTFVYDSSGKLKSTVNFTGNNSGYRYIGVYSNQDWRCYTSSGGNISNTNISFYKYVPSTTPTCTTDPTSLAFGEIQVGDSDSKTVTVTTANLSSALSLSVGAGYAVSPTSIAANATSTTVTVTCTPTAIGAQNGTLTISGGGLASNVTVDLTAAGTCAPAATALAYTTPVNLTLEDDDVEYTLTPTPNTGNGGAITYALKTNPGENGMVDGNVFTAVETGTYVVTATQAVNGTTCGGTFDITINVHGVDPVCTIDPEIGVFGTVAVGESASQTFTVTTANLTGNVSLAMTNPAFTVSPTTILQNASSTEITITFTPSEAGDAEAYLTANGGGISNNELALVSGTGATPLTITFNAGTGSCATPSMSGLAGSPITLPTASPSSTCATDGWTFAGWATAAVAIETTTAPNPLYAAGDSYTIGNADVTLYAVYKLVNDNSADTDNVFESGSYSNSVITWTVNNVVSIKQEKNSGNTAPNSSYVSSPRWYSGNKITITPSNTINYITVIATSEGYATTLAGSTYTNASASANGTEVTITPTNGNNNITIVMANQSRLSSLTVNYGSSSTTYFSSPNCLEKVATPEFTVAAGTYTSVQSVEITCETSGATIKYKTTENGEWQNYNGAISVGEDMTIWAKAVKADMADSDEVSAAYVINLPLTTMDAIYAKATANGDNASNVNVVFDYWVVSGVGTGSGNNPNNVFVTDNNGKGFIIYKSGHGFAVNNKLSGSVNGTPLKLYNNAAEFTNLTSTTEGLTVTNDGSITVIPRAITELSGINTGSVVTINNVRFDGTYLKDASNNEIKPYNLLYAYGSALQSDHVYNVTGVYLQYGETKEICPRSGDDIELVTYPITIDSEIEHGTVIAAVSAEEGASVNLTITPDATYALKALTVYKTGDESTVVSTVNPFTMPAYGVTVTAEFGKEYTVTYYRNAVANDETAELTYGEGGNVTVLNYDDNDVDFERPEGKLFSKWNTQADGKGTDYLPETTITNIQANYDLYAQWRDIVYHITYDVNGETSGPVDVNYNESIDELPTPSLSPLTFLGWSTTGATGPVNVTAPYEPTGTTENITLYAVFGSTGTDDLEIIGTTTGIPTGYGSGTWTINSLNFYQSQIMQENESGTKVIQFKKSSAGYLYNESNFGKIKSIQITTVSGALTVKEGANEKPSSGTSIDPNFSDGVYTYTFSGNNNYFYIINATSNAIRAYSIVINYETAVPVTIITGEETLTSLPATPVVVANGGVLTFTGTNTDNTKLIIEDGGQLITNNSVKATVKKTITGHGAKATYDGWTFIASPVVVEGGVNPAAVSGMINATATKYDLYRFNDGVDKEWENYKNTEDHPNFTLVNGKGYLYANEDGTSLDFAGDVNPSTPDINVSLQYTEGQRFAGWNLVGNPFTADAYITNMSYYKMENDGKGNVVINPSSSFSGAIKPCEGVMVKANDGGENVTFTTTEPEGSANNGNINIALAQIQATRGEKSLQTLDNAIVSFNEGSELGKFYFGTQKANIYIPLDNEEYAIVSAEACGEMPVNFKAVQDGQYTITVNPENVEMGYLHLIDNIAGTDIDLLANPSYTFNAKGDDYKSRFRLVFSANLVNADQNDDFAFFSNGMLVIANEGESILQVIDVNGRIIATESVNGTCSKAINAKAGVYVLRLINGTDVKTQKIVIR